MKTPWHIWVVGVLSLLWHAGGAFDYLMSHLRPAFYIEMIPADVRPQMLAYLDGYPVWATAAWAVGVWGAVLGSVLILARSRFAVAALWGAMAGLVVNTVHNYLVSDVNLEQITGTGAMVFSAAIFAVLALVLAYASRQRSLGRLR
jgi:hypothetical protein